MHSSYTAAFTGKIQIGSINYTIYLFKNQYKYFLFASSHKKRTHRDDLRQIRVIYSFYSSIILQGPQMPPVSPKPPVRPSKKALLFPPAHPLRTVLHLPQDRGLPMAPRLQPGCHPHQRIRIPLPLRPLPRKAQSQALPSHAAL